MIIKQKIFVGDEIIYSTHNYPPKKGKVIKVVGGIIMISWEDGEHSSLPSTLSTIKVVKKDK